MGCFNTTGFLSRLSIKYGDRVVAFICQTTDNTFVISRYYQDSNISPIFLPVFGEYDDYGSIENIDDTYSSRLLRQIFNGTDPKKYSNVLRDYLQDQMETLKTVRQTNMYTMNIKMKLTFLKEIVTIHGIMEISQSYLNMKTYTRNWCQNQIAGNLCLIM